MLKISAWMFFALGLAHVAIALFGYSVSSAEVLADGFINQFKERETDGKFNRIGSSVVWS